MILFVELLQFLQKLIGAQFCLLPTWLLLLLHDELRPVLLAILSLLFQIAALEGIDEALKVCLAAGKRRTADAVETLDLVLKL